MSETKKPIEIKLQIKLDEAIAQGSYTNLAIVNHSETEFVIDFMFVQPQSPQARVNSRIVTSPRHAKRLLRALEENLRRYEQTFGSVELSDQLPEPVGDYH